MWKLMILIGVITSGTLSGETKVLAFAGSTSNESINKKLILETADVARQMGAEVSVINLKDYSIPFYDGDLEAKEGMPLKVKQFRQLMIQNNVIIIASPEYNASVSAVLKNALDWASRGEDARPSREAFKGKKFVLMSASPGSSGGVRGLVHLKAIIEEVGGSVVNEQVVVPHAYNAFDKAGKLKSEALKKEIQTVIKSVLK